MGPEEGLAVHYWAKQIIKKYHLERINNPLERCKVLLDLTLGGRVPYFRASIVGDKLITESKCVLIRKPFPNWCDKFCENYANALVKAACDKLRAKRIEKGEICRFEITLEKH
ncbi:hypothetical protein DRN86_03395 [Candidatus Geothermarchaeota archaeon]|nr:MAG: hypothetical protein DRN86_03395 [Candidatus Geothermarchaeota archaeon]